MADTPLSAEQVSAKLAQMNLALNPQIPYRYESLFAKLEGWGAKGYIQRKHKLIHNVEGVLPRMLRPGEEVLYVGKGVYTSVIEQYFMGALLAMLVNQTVFVLTNLRLIMIHSNTKGVPGHTFWTIFYNQITTFKAAWTGTTKLHLRDGVKLTFSGFEKLDRKQMPAVFEQALAGYRELGFDPAVSQSRENLCSHCFEVVPKNIYRCSKCAADFWTPTAIALRSLIFPSWGDFLMRHTSAAILELLGYVITWLVLLTALVGGWARGIEDFIGALIVTVFVLAFEHGVDATLTYFVARKGLNPKRV